MSGFADLVKDCQPAFFGGGAVGEATEGQTWLWPFDEVNDDDGDPIDLTGVSATCKVWEGSETVVTLTFTGAVGSFTVGAAKATTAGKAGTKLRRQCRWSLELDDGTDSIMIWGPATSAFTILSEDGVDD